jgi:G3E family GTPase
MTVKTNDTKRAMTLGDFIAGAYRAWGARRAKGLVWLAVNARLVEFQGPQLIVISDEQHENLSFKANAQ